jgi:hypothetical protein
VGTTPNVERVLVDTPVENLTVQEATSGPTNPQVDDLIVNEPTNDDIVAQFPTTTNEHGVDQVLIDANGQIQGLDADKQPTATPTE